MLCECMEPAEVDVSAPDMIGRSERKTHVF